MENGDIVGTTGAAPGLLVLDTTYGEAEIDGTFECSRCDAGLLIRSQKNGDSISGVLVALTGPNVGSLYRIELDGSGKEVSRKPMPAAGSEYEVPPGGSDFLIKGSCMPVPCAGISNAHGGGLGSPGAMNKAAKLAAKTDAPNQFSVVMGGDLMTGFLNGARLHGARMDGGHSYGQVALYIAGPSGSEVRFKNISIADHTTRVSGLVPEQVGRGFRMEQLSDVFYAEGAAVGDINHDGHPDVVSGAFYYTGPDFKEAHEIYPPAAIAIAGAEYPGGPPVSQGGMITHGNYPPSFMSWVYDFNGDGWSDVLMVMSFGPRPTFSAHLFINPKGELRHWDNFEVVSLITNEANQFVDIDGDGRPELSMQLATLPDWSDAQVGYAKPDWSDPTKPWKFVPVSEHGRWSGHGLASGDVNGDGKLDLVSPAGWWEQPAQATKGFWKYHQARFGNGGAEMFVYDVNGDGRPDIVTSLAAHGPGLAWFEQLKDGTFEQHTIMKAPADRTSKEELAFTELHAMAFADVDGDGLPDIVTGKRWWSHGYRYDEENDIDDPAVLYWFKLVRKEGGQAEFLPQMIHNRSGVGVQIAVADVNQDGKPDVVTSARKGTFVFLNDTTK